jgi:(E)-4-hydroxy-3-methylbut-2-enyl-diphosphate synthase
MERKETSVIRVGSVLIGGKNPVSVQSMNNTDTRDVPKTLAQIRLMADAGCDITRVAIPDMQAAEALKSICSLSPIPVVADIHFDYRLALESIRSGASKIRINPGNIGGADRLRQVAQEAKKAGIPIRVGVNSGSIHKEFLDRFGGVNEDSMVQSALQSIRQLEECDFNDIVVSIKASDPVLTIKTYRLLSTLVGYPLHLGVTEAGTPKEGIVRSAIGIGTLLAEGIGDTIRVSLTGDPVMEVECAVDILKSLHMRARGIEIISCPTCGRTCVDLIHLAEQAQERFKDIREPIRIAIMGCAVNGPGEAKEADLGIAGGVGEYLLFAKGEIIRKIPEDLALEELTMEVGRFLENRKNKDGT